MKQIRRLIIGDRILYDLMDWAGIERNWCIQKHQSRHAGTSSGGIRSLDTAPIPTAAQIVVKIASTGRKYTMELADEAGFFAVLIPRKSLAAYTLLVTYDNGVTDQIHDPIRLCYQFTSEGP